MAAQWMITAEERRKHDEQFLALNPANGFITGNQAREFFLQSGLPPAALAQIWDLADFNKDGKMDRREFSIAMNLIKKKLQGTVLPSTLPDSLKLEPTALTSGVLIPSMTYQGTISAITSISINASQPWMPPAMPSAMGQSSAMAPVMRPSIMQPSYFGVAPAGMVPAAPIVQPAAPIQPTKTHVDWTMPQSSKLKYSQQFNSIDKEKTGFLSGAQARGVFGHSDLPSQTLAMIWYLSDLDKDGRLTVDEFAIASYLIDMVKHGAALPKSLPPELAPTNWQRGLRHQRTSSFGSSDDATMSPKLSDSFSYESGDILKAPKMVVTFEDKRRQNLERGQAEIERRRMILQEQEKREREERERKQREERERQEREREEQERKRQQEFEWQQVKLREEHEIREREYRRMLEQKEAAIREAERQRQQELARQRLQELRNQRQREQEAVCHSKQTRKNLSYQVQALTEKAHDLNARITDMRNRVGTATASFEMMKTTRDKTLLEIETGSRKVQELRTKSMQYENEKVSLLAKKRNAGAVTNSSVSDIYRQTLVACKSSESNLESMRRSLTEVDDLIRKKQLAIQSKETSSRHSVDHARKEASEYRELVQRVNGLLAKVRQAKGGVAAASNGLGYGTATNGPWQPTNGGQYNEAPCVTPAANTAQYQVVYDFDSANEGELTLKVGDIVLVFIDHPVEEGWLAGQIGDKVGWFPRDFAVPLNQTAGAVRAQAMSSSENEAVTTASESVTETIRRFEERKHEIEAAQASAPTVSKTSNTPEWYVAAYPFAATELGDLGFEVGEKILVIEKGGDWWTGRIGDREGVFPCNYLKEISSLELTESSVSETVTKPKGKTKSPPVVSVPIPVMEETPAVVVTEGAERDEPVTLEEEATYEVAQAIAEYKAADDNQLTLTVGDLIKIRSKSPTGWWEGELQKKGERPKVGWFPGSYVEIRGGDNGENTQRVQDQPEDRPNGNISGGDGVVEAIFDYIKQQEDELSFSRGSMIVVLDKQDGDWWRGRLSDGQEGLIPTNYVKARSSSNTVRNGDAASISQPSSASSTPTSELRKRSMYCQELEQTEQNYADDLQMVVDVFYKQFEVSGLLAPKEMGTLFVNWLELLAVANTFGADLRSNTEERMGATILKNIDNLKKVFVNFCGHQQSALDFLEAKEKASARFRALHAQCSQHPAAKGLQLSYFLLIPLARVTKYHLTVKEILKYTPTEHADYANLQKAHTALRQLCDEVNEVATETENLQMLYWCQNHLRCDQIQPKLVFHSPTNSLGPRRFIHSGILYKMTSNRLLVGLLFNDFLMLTTPDERISQPDTFKLSRTSEIALVLYKTPILLTRANLQPPAASGTASDGQNQDDNTIALNYGEDVINLRAISSNAKIFWTKQLDKAIKHAREAGSARSRSITISSSGIGRLLLEVVFVRNLTVPQDCKGASFYIEFSFGRQKHAKSIDLSRTDTLCTTQMVLDSKTGLVQLAIFAERVYSPDICVGRTDMELGAMLKMAGSQRNPAVKQLALTSDLTAQTDAVSGHIIVKFVVQLFDDQ